MAVSVSVSESLRSVLNDSLSGVGKEYSITHLAEASDRNFNKITSNQIYKKKMLSGLNFLSNHRIKTTAKQIFSLQNKQHDIYLVTRDNIRRYNIKYDFLHIGLVQVYLVPLGLTIHRDAKILVCLRDAKYANLKESILAAFEINLLDGAKFNWFPNFSSSLSDLSNSNGLVITVEPRGYSLAKGYEDSRVFAIEYNMCYKLMKGSLLPRSRFENPVLELNTERSTVLVPESVRRN